jgi:hypothetical protein
MVAGADEFYLSAFRSVDGDTETTLYSLPRSDENFVERFRASELGEGLPISAMGLAVDVSDGSTLHGYVALVDDVDGANPRVSHLRFDDLSSPTSTVAGLGYPTDRPDRYPKAFVVDDAVHGAWIDLDGSITMQAASGETITFNSAPGVPARATSFAPIASASTPGVLFSRVRGTVIQELRGGAQVQLEQCLTGVDDFLTMRSVPIGDPGAWLVGWTASTQGNFATESRLLVCSDDAGCLPQPCDVGDTVWPNVRHAAEALMALDAGGFVLATALPSLDAGQAALTLQVRRVDYGEVAVDEPVVETLDEFEVSSLPAGAGLEGPDWPALSFLPPGKLALSWLEPESGQGVTALRVRRYDVCLGAD